MLDARAVSLAVNVPDVVVLADDDKLLQVIVNLVENAAVHGPANEEAELAGWLEGEWLHLEVRDRGAPLDEATVESLFEPHSRGRGKAKGTGLGLYIVRSIASRWGGRTWGGPSGSGGQGNAFGVSVPLVQER